MPQKYFIHFSHAEDFNRLLNFYDMNAHTNVLKRDTDLMAQLVKEGAVIIVEDENGVIVASSITYAHKVADKDGVERVEWQEVGTTRSTLNGYPGLFDAMIAMQVMRTFLVEPPENMMVAHMVTAPVQNLASKLGWRPMEGGAPLELLKAKEKTLSNSNQAAADNWFVCGIESLPTLAKWFEKVMDNPLLENKKTHEQIELDFSKSSFFRLFKAEIHNIASKNFGDIDRPDQKQNVHQQRDKWLKKFFR